MAHVLHIYIPRKYDGAEMVQWHHHYSVNNLLKNKLLFSEIIWRWGEKIPQKQMTQLFYLKASDPGFVKHTLRG